MREARNVLKLPTIGVLILCEGGCARRAKEEGFCSQKNKDFYKFKYKSLMKFGSIEVLVLEEDVKYYPLHE